ncbi:YicC family protein [Candidatus Bipolaricaulota bacterium]|nr:YicC family protein [Candidatus Bipolaricaulota bacterium]
MIRSMTGFGSGAARGAGWRVEATVRTLNHRFLSVRIRGLTDRPGLQAQAEQHVRQRFGRGEVNVWLELSRDRSDGSSAPIDREAAAEMHTALKALAEELGIPESPTLGDLIRTGSVQLTQESDEGLWPPIREALDEAVGAALDARRAEGEVLARELARILDVQRDSIATISARLPEIIEAMQEKLAERARELEIAVDADRLEAEIALLIERHDIQEEIARLAGHFDRAVSLQQAKNPVGKELDFISQEMLREVNTIGSKVRDVVVSGLVIDMKVAVEQLREQIQNVE